MSATQDGLMLGAEGTSSTGYSAPGSWTGEGPRSWAADTIAEGAAPDGRLIPAPAYQLETPF